MLLRRGVTKPKIGALGLTSLPVPVVGIPTNSPPAPTRPYPSCVLPRSLPSSFCCPPEAHDIPLQSSPLRVSRRGLGGEGGFAILDSLMQHHPQFRLLIGATQPTRFCRFNEIVQRLHRTPQVGAEGVALCFQTPDDI